MVHREPFAPNDMVTDPTDADELAKLYARYPFLRFNPGDRSQYIPPAYYDSLIKPYTFGSTEDLSLMDSEIEGLARRTPAPVIMELGGGSGRATTYVLQKLKSLNAQPSQYHVNDLSPGMIASLSSTFAQEPGFAAHNLDHLEMLETIPPKLPSIDFAFSQWSLSHSIHQHIERDGLGIVLDRVISIFDKLADSLAAGGQVHIVHFDTKCEEQRIMVRQYEKYFWEFRDIGEQSLSKQLLDSVTKYLNTTRTDIIATVTHHEGDAIYYANMDEALEVFLNFHAEGEFNQMPSIVEIVREMTADLSQYLQPDGSLLIRPGCFTYQITKSS